MTSALTSRLSRRTLLRTCLLAATLTVGAACSRLGPPNDENDGRFDPIAIHVRNENFLDVNVSVVVGGSSRRLGQVTGNSEADFNVPWSTGNGSGVVLMATPIGARGSVTMPALNVSPGQMIEFRVASLIRQSSVSVREP